ncbi:MAG TPA: threonine/serine dehydratase [Gemmatimonadales bacterium]|jgi:threonine dehydratase|nr:threonine/serine dehydratase [Gemmatimonadales bacterium]
MPLTADSTAAVTLESLRAAARVLEGVAARTPLLELPDLAARVGAPVLLKCELLQPVGAFKIRGAYNAVARAAAAGARGMVTQSSGNHGQAVAFAARRFGLQAVVVMPASTPAVKVEGVRGHGGEVVFAGATRSGEQRLRAEAIAREQDLAMIPPYDHPDVIAGQGTCGLEILEQRPDVGTILVPVSGGGLIAGISVAVAALAPAVRVVGVEPAGAAKLTAALAAGAPRTLDHTESIADGLLAPSVGNLTFDILRQVVREAVTVEEEEIAAAVRYLHLHSGLRAEPSGAVAVAALLAGRVQPAGPTVAVLSGGNVDPDLYQRLVAE